MDSMTPSCTPSGTIWRGMGRAQLLSSTCSDVHAGSRLGILPAHTECKERERERERTTRGSISGRI